MSAAGKKHRVAVIAEGKGDCDAIVDLLAKAADFLAIHNLVFDKSVIRGGCLNRVTNDIEKLATLATVRDTNPDYLIIVVDCEDTCPVEAAKKMTAALREVIKRRSLIGGAICFLVREYESIFISDLENLSKKIPGIKFDPELPPIAETFRDAKGVIAGLSRDGYKPTRDQKRYTKVVDCKKLEVEHRSFQHLRNALKWLSVNDPLESAVFPEIA